MFDKLKTKIAFDNRNVFAKSKEAPAELKARAATGDQKAIKQLKKYKASNGAHFDSIGQESAPRTKQTLAVVQLKKTTGLDSSFIRDAMELIHDKNINGLNRAVANKNEWDFGTADLMRLRDGLLAQGAKAQADIIQAALEAQPQLVVDEHGQPQILSKDDLNNWTPDGARFIPGELRAPGDFRNPLDADLKDQMAAARQRAPGHLGALGRELSNVGNAIEAGLRKTKAKAFTVPAMHTVREGDKLARNVGNISAAVVQDGAHGVAVAAEYGWEKAGDAVHLAGRKIVQGYELGAQAVRATSEAVANGAHNTRLKATELPLLDVGANQKARYADRDARINKVIAKVTKDVDDEAVAAFERSRATFGGDAQSFVVPHMHQDEVRRSLAAAIPVGKLPLDKISGPGQALTNAEIKYLARSAKGDFKNYPLVVNGATSFEEAVHFVAQDIVSRALDAEKQRAVVQHFQANTQARRDSNVSQQDEDKGSENSKNGGVGTRAKAKALWKSATAAVKPREGSNKLQKTPPKTTPASSAPTTPETWGTQKQRDAASKIAMEQLTVRPYSTKDWADYREHTRAVELLAESLTKMDNNDVPRIATVEGPFRMEGSKNWVNKTEKAMKQGPIPDDITTTAVLPQAALFKRLAAGALTESDFALNGATLQEDADIVAERWANFSPVQKAVVDVARVLLQEGNADTTKITSANIGLAAKELFPFSPDLNKDLHNVIVGRALLSQNNVPRSNPAYAELKAVEERANTAQGQRIDRFINACLEAGVID